MRAINIVALAAGWILVAASPGLLADEIYKSVAKDGSVTYSQAPQPGARNTVVDIQVLSPETRRAALILQRKLEGADLAMNDAFEKRERAWRDADIEIRDATEKLQIEESTLDSGREPRGDEWVGNLGGGARLSEAYFERLKALEDRVAQARARLDRAYDARNALK
ncbi:MAG TPA: DUF4124 domain-containing protein [Usitatibacter sp.]|nr:DUF4124 domain-containing protein [Usitatibacter sp.]